MRFVLLSCLITAVLGSGLYFAKLSVDEQYRTLKRLEEEIKIQTEHNYVLQAEWTFLTRPERLLELSESLLGMSPITPERDLTNFINTNRTSYIHAVNQCCFRGQKCGILGL